MRGDEQWSRAFNQAGAEIIYFAAAVRRTSEGVLGLNVQPAPSTHSAHSRGALKLGTDRRDRAGTRVGVIRRAQFSRADGISAAMSFSRVPVNLKAFNLRRQSLDTLSQSLAQVRPHLTLLRLSDRACLVQVV